MSHRFNRGFAWVVAWLVLFASPHAFAEEFFLKSNESIDLFAVYWVKDCKSLLTSFAGVDVMDGPPGVTLSIREQDVLPQRQGCPSKVPGGIVAASVKDISAKLSGSLRFRVRYNTTDGLKYSNHTVQLSLFP
jgi:hypothetical protein